MKKLRNFLLVSVTMLAFLLIGCPDLTGDDSGSSSSGGGGSSSNNTPNNWIILFGDNYKTNYPEKLGTKQWPLNIWGAGGKLTGTLDTEATGGANGSSQAWKWTSSGDPAWAAFAFQGDDPSLGSVDTANLSNYQLTYWVKVSNAGSGVKVSAQFIDSANKKKVYTKTISTTDWTKVTVTKAELAEAGIDLTKIKTISFHPFGDGTTVVKDSVMYFDEIYLEEDSSVVQAPGAAPTVPTRSATVVTSIYSDTYTTATGVNLNPTVINKTTTHTELDLSGNKVIKLANTNVQEIDFSANTLNLTTLKHTHLHIDIWSQDATSKIRLALNTAGSSNAEVGYKDLTVTAGKWTSLDIPITDFKISGTNALTSSTVRKIKFDPAGAGASGITFFYDNLYFYHVPPQAPTSAPSNPTKAQASVKSIYSETYTPVSNAVNLNPSWGQATTYSEVTLTGGKVIKLANTNYQGIVFGANVDTATDGYTHVHIDLWVAETAKIWFFLVSSTSVNSSDEGYKELTATGQQWTSIDIPITDFKKTGGVAMASKIIHQMKLDAAAAGSTGVTFFYDNIYFYK